MNDYLDLFLSYLLVEKGLTKNTIEAYSRDVGGYLTFLERSGRHGVADVSPSDVAAFIAGLKEAGLAPRSRARALSAVRMFHRFLLVESYTASNPTAIIESPRMLSRLPEILSPREVEVLLKASS